MNSKFRVIPAMAFLLAACASLVQAGEQSVKVIMPWNGDGSIHSIGVDRVMFMGEFEGIMYAETDAGDLDAAFASCPATQYIDIQTKKTSASGYCDIAVSGEDSVFAEWSCEGKLGACSGTFTLTGGTGKYKGVTGSSELKIRSVLSTLVAGMTSGSVVHTASGLAILPRLTYKLDSAD